MSSKAPSYRELLAFALPAMLAVVTEPVAGILDTAMVGRLDSRWLAALAMSASIFSSFTWVFNFLVHGVTARVAQATGRGDRAAVDRFIGLSLWISFALGLGVLVLLFLLEDLLLARVMGADPSLVEIARPYYRVRALGFPFVLVLTSMSAVYRGLQRIDASFWLLFFTTLFNAVVTFLLLYVFEWGLEGAAWGTSLSFFLGAVVGVGYLRWVEPSLVWFSRFRWAEITDFGEDAGHIFGRTAVLTGAFFLTTATASRLSETALAAHQIALQCWLLASFLIDGLAVTATAVGGKFVGQGESSTFYLVSKRLLWMGFGVGMLFLVFFAVLEIPLAHLFTADPAVLAQLAALWMLVVVTQPLNAVLYVFDGIFFGSRDFAFLRRRMWEGAGLIFLPALAYAYWEAADLYYVWLALIGLNAYRLGSAALWFSRRRLRAA